MKALAVGLKFFDYKKSTIWGTNFCWCYIRFGYVPNQFRLRNYAAGPRTRHCLSVRESPTNSPFDFHLHIRRTVFDSGSRPRYEHDMARHGTAHGTERRYTTECYTQATSRRVTLTIRRAKQHPLCTLIFCDSTCGIGYGYTYTYSVNLGTFEVTLGLH